MATLVGTEALFTVETVDGAPDGLGTLWAYQFTAVESGNATELHFKVSDTVACAVTTVWLAIYSDSGDAPDDLLGSVEVPGNPGLGDTVTGSLSAPVAIVSGDKYWLSFLGAGPGGGDKMAWAQDVVTYTGGTSAWFGEDSFTEPQDPWPLSTEFDKPGGGPLTLWATGEAGAPDLPPGLVWQVTGLWYPDAETVDFYGTIADPIGGTVRIPRNDSRTAQVTVSAFDPIVDDLVGHAYARCLKVYYNRDLVFWGPCKLNDMPSMAAGEVTISAVDPSLRLVQHFIRRGDINGDLGADTQDRATVPIDHIGLRTIRDSGNNTAGQTTRGVPDLGIADGTNDFVAAPDDLMGVARGDQSWEAMLQLSQSLGPDFELEPVEGTPGVYVMVNTFASQGTDKSATVVFHYGTGKDNLDDLGFTEGSKYVTHVQVLDRESTYRITPANLETSAITGPYVDWVVTEFDARNVPEDEALAVLLAHGRDILNAYSHPLIIVTLTLPVEQDADFRYIRDFLPGDIIGVAGRAGYVDLPEADYRISVVTLKQEGPENATRTELEVVASRTVDTDTED